MIISTIQKSLAHFLAFFGTKLFLLYPDALIFSPSSSHPVLSPSHLLLAQTMAITCNLAFAVQILTIIAGIWGIIVAIIFVITESDLGGIIFNAFLMLFCCLLIMSEIYVAAIMRYVAFIQTIWGKGCFFLFMGFFEFRQQGVGLAAAISFWILFILYVILFCVIGGTAPPLTQTNNPPQYETTEEEYYKEEDAQNVDRAPESQTTLYPTQQ
jgi:hypothetical protein